MTRPSTTSRRAVVLCLIAALLGGGLLVGYRKWSERLQLQASANREAQVLSFVRQGRREQAREELLRMRREFPRAAFVPMTLGHYAVDEGDEATAEVEFRRATELAPSDPDAWYQLGMVLGQAQQYDQAMVAFGRANTLRPRDPDSLTALGFCSLAAGHPEQAIDWLRMAHSVAPDHPEANRYLGEALYVQPGGPEQLEEAEAALRQAVTQAPEFGPAWFWLGRVYLRRGKQGEAIAALRRALQVAPQDEGALQLLGQTLLRSGKTAEGQTLLQRFRRLAEFKVEIDQLDKRTRVEPGNVELWLQMARLHSRMELWPQAAREYEQGLRLAPENKEAQRGLAAARRQMEKMKRVPPVRAR